MVERRKRQVHRPAEALESSKQSNSPRVMRGASCRDSEIVEGSSDQGTVAYLAQKVQAFTETVLGARAITAAQHRMTEVEQRTRHQHLIACATCQRQTLAEQLLSRSVVRPLQSHESEVIEYSAQERLIAEATGDSQRLVVRQCRLSVVAGKIGYGADLIENLGDLRLVAPRAGKAQTFVIKRRGAGNVPLPHRGEPEPKQRSTDGFSVVQPARERQPFLVHSARFGEQTEFSGDAASRA